MATTMYFEETIVDQGGRATMELEIGRSSYYEEDSVYIRIGNEAVCMNRETAQRFVKAVSEVGFYHGFIEK